MQDFMKGCAFAAIAVALSAGTAAAGDPDSCKKVRLSDVGWTDITATTAVTSAILTALGYEPETQVLSVPGTSSSNHAQTDIVVTELRSLVEIALRESRTTAASAPAY